MRLLNGTLFINQDDEQLGVGVDLTREEGKYKVSIKLLDESSQPIIVIQLYGKDLSELTERIKFLKDLLTKVKGRTN